ncbi:MAG TPA: hypothetical protein VMR74_06995 [Gammaproteobacteria bacterium]|nr:hypothetical protein [Gammaproteobacteria bacterium]
MSLRSAGITAGVLVLAAAMLAPWDRSLAEPYLAVESGLKCNTCHTNPTGGGKRNLFGMTYARSNIAVTRLLQGEDTQGWNSEINRWLGIGGDYRGGYSSVDVPGSSERTDWMTRRATAYLEIRPLPGLVTLYADRHMAPDDSFDREAYLLLTPKEGRYTVKAGQMFLPYGLRLEDDSTFVRQRSGINFDTPDDGVEFGLELPRWSAQAAFSNGTAGAGSRPGKDQTSLSMSYVLSRWRVGTSVNINEDPLGDREMLAVFAGLRTGPVSWLAEVDRISDDLGTGGSRDIEATLFEGNWRIRPGHNLKFSYEFLDPSDLVGDDEEERYRVVWEFSPFQLFQTRAGFTSYNGVPSLPHTNRTELFVEAHVYF